MKILCIITGMTSGGAERVMSILCNEFVKSSNNKVKLAIIKNNDSDYYISEKVERSTGNVKNKNLIKSIKFVKKEIEEFEPDIILSFMTKTNIVAILAKMLCKVKPPLVITERANPFYTKKLYAILRRILYPKANACIFQTKLQQQYYNNIIKTDNSRIIKNPLAPDFNIPPYKGTRNKKIVSTARLSPEKNQKLLIKAFTKIVNKYQNYKLEIYGEGPEREKLEKLINKLNLQDKIFLKGRKNNIIECIKDAEIFVLPSNSEGMPNSLIEAMALGIPSIATDCPIGGSAEIIKNNQNGLLIKMNEESELIKAMELLIDNLEIRERLSKEATKVVQEFEAKKVCSEWLDYLIEVSNKNKQIIK